MMIKAIKLMMFASTLLLMGLTPNPDQGRQVAAQKAAENSVKVEAMKIESQKVDREEVESDRLEQNIQE